MGCVSELDDEFIERMEDVLSIYERPDHPHEPVVCLDERPVPLHDEKYRASRATPGRPARYDYEYVRRGTANVFCVVEPLAGRHLSKATRTRNGAEFAHMLRDIARAYRRAQTIHLVIDNLSTHSDKSLIKHLGPRRGPKLWQRFTVHYTPKHGSWLNQAEIVIGVMNRQCLGKRRLGRFGVLAREVESWRRDVDARRLPIHWRFTQKDAQDLFDYKPLIFKWSED